MPSPVNRAKNSAHCAFFQPTKVGFVIIGAVSTVAPIPVRVRLIPQTLYTPYSLFVNLYYKLKQNQYGLYRVCGRRVSD